jgi:hypothetical protein
MDGFCLASGATGRVAFVLARLFVSIGIATASAFDPIQFSGGGEVVALVSAGQMPAEFEVGDHLNASFVAWLSLDNPVLLMFAALGRKKIPAPGWVF